MIQTSEIAIDPGAVSPALQRVVVGVDGSPESLAAMRQAAALTPAGAELVLVDAVGPAHDAALGVLEGAARRLATDRAVSARVVVGAAGDVLVTAAAAADLVAVGLRGHSPGAGVLYGRAATVLLHEAPCPVLVARPARPDVPAAITAAVDGSARSLAALDLAVTLARQTGARLTALTATAGQRLDLDAIRAAVGRRAVELRVVDVLPPAEALVADPADLLVLGSRGLRGLRSLGSVSEAAGRHARASVLVVRARRDVEEPGGADR